MRVLIIRFFILLGLFFPVLAAAANISLVGASYQISGSTVVLSADKVVNNDTGGTSGTLKMTLWAFPSPFDGTQSGYTLATYTLGQLNGGYYYSGISSGTITYTPPPNGTWYYTLFVEEFNGSWFSADYVNFQVISFGAAPLIAVGGTGTVSATATSGLTVTYSSTTPSICTVSGSTVTAVTPGICTIAANQAGNTTYNPGTQVTQSITISAPIVEFYNTNLDHYFITADSGEAAAIDSGSAGPGWSRTGNTFSTNGSAAVCRFYGSQAPGPNSHFYTADSGECDYLKQLQANTPLTEKRWNYEGIAFAATMPTNGTCLSGTVPVYRAYNKGDLRGVDSNHRITANLNAIQQVVALGWENEGVVMCAYGATNIPVLDVASYVSLNAGNQWTYSSNYSGGSKITTVGSPITLPSGVVAIPVTTVHSRDGSSVTYSTMDGNGYRNHQGYDPTVTYTYSPALTSVPAYVTVGSTYTSTGTVSLKYTDGLTLTLDYSSSTKIAGFETVYNYDGKQSWSAVKVVHSLTISGTVNGQFSNSISSLTEWLAEGIGIVQDYRANTSGSAMETWNLEWTNVTP